MNNKLFICSIIVLLPLLMSLSFPAQVGDLSIWVKLGLDSLASGYIITSDTYSFLETSPMVYPAWGASILYALSYKVLGLEFVFFFHYLIVAFLFLMLLKLYKLPEKLVVSFPSVLITLFSIIVSATMLNERPALLALPLFLGVYYIFQKQSKISKKDIWTLFFLIVLWINIHGSALMIIGLSAWYLFTSIISHKKIRLKDLLISFGSIGALFINPFGYKVFPYAVLTREMSKLRKITEWESTFDFSSYFIWCYLILIAFYLYTLYKSRFNQKFKEILFDPVFPLIVLGGTTVRQGVFSFIVLLPFLYKHKLMESIFPKKANQDLFSNRKINGVIIILMMIICFVLMPFWKKNFLFLLPKNKQFIVKQFYPIKEINYLKKHNIKGHIYNQFELGSHLVLELPNKIMLDTRSIIYSQKDFDDYIHVLSVGDNWQNILDKHSVEVILIEKKNSLLVEAVQKSCFWEKINLSKTFFLATKKLCN